MFHFVFIAEAKTFVRSGRSGCHDGPKRWRYSIEFTNLVTIPREEPRQNSWDGKNTNSSHLKNPIETSGWAEFTNGSRRIINCFFIGLSLSCLWQEQRSRSESVAVFLRGHEARHHPARVVGCVQHLDPLRIESVRLPPEIAKVFHHRVCLMIVLGRHFGALHDLS